MKCFRMHCPSGFVICCKDCTLGEVIKCPDKCSENPRECPHYEEAAIKTEDKKINKWLLIILLSVLVVAALIFWSAYKDLKHLDQTQNTQIEQTKEPVTETDPFN